MSANDRSSHYYYFTIPRTNNFISSTQLGASALHILIMRFNIATVLYALTATTQVVASPAPLQHAKAPIEARMPDSLQLTTGEKKELSIFL